MDSWFKAESRELMRLPFKASMMLSLLVLFQHSATAADANQGSSEPKMISGISIVGNNETPKSLFIVPWKSSEIGAETNLSSGMMDDSMRPVDKEVFMREINFYDIRQGK